MYGQSVSIVGAQFRSPWVKRSADADRESLGEFGPAFVSDLLVLGHVQAGQARVHLQEVDRKGLVSGALNWLETHGKQCASQLLSGVKTHQEYVCVGGGGRMWVAFMRMGNQTKTSANQHGKAGHGDNGGRACK